MRNTVSLYQNTNTCELLLIFKIFLGRSPDTQLDVGYLNLTELFSAPNFVFRLILTTKSFCSRIQAMCAGGDQPEIFDNV